MSLNENAARIASEIERRAGELGVRVFSLKKGARVIDCGVQVEGSLEAGRLYSLACLGGLGEVRVVRKSYGSLELPAVSVETRDPWLACIGSQKAGWKVSVGGFHALGSGPARMLLGSARRYREESDVAVLALECSRLPGDEVAEYVAGRCGVSCSGLTLLAVRTASIAGSTQVSARMVETALYKMERLGYRQGIVYARGFAPIAPVLGDDAVMMGVANDMIIYGSQVFLEVEGEMDVEPLPSISSPSYGKPFVELYQEAGRDFYRIDSRIFAPAEVVARDIRTGVERRAGRVNAELIARSLSSR